MRTNFEKTYDINNLFNGDQIEERILLKEYIKSWHQEKGLSPIRGKDGGLRKNSANSLRDLYTFNLKEGDIYFGFIGKIERSKNKEMFDETETFLLKVLKNYKRFILFEKICLNDCGISTSYKESILKFDITNNDRFLTDSEGAAEFSQLLGLCKIPPLQEMQKNYFNSKKVTKKTF